MRSNSPSPEKLEESPSGRKSMGEAQPLISAFFVDDAAAAAAGVPTPEIDNAVARVNSSRPSQGSHSAFQLPFEAFESAPQENDATPGSVYHTADNSSASSSDPEPDTIIPYEPPIYT
jgi:hypothetical protein